ncbi:MAG TPA: PPOX class F420-dependent oxidoreductase [Dehalococcoidia bacterium]|nr:PPOX class F420-dependent oxidoreductase [Dehalococcoidia bacterium]
MSVPTPEVADFLAGPHVAAFSTVRPGGKPHVVPVWYEYDGTGFIISTFRETQKLRNLEAKPAAALSIYTSELPYKQVTVEGPARIGSLIDNVWRERVAARYLGETAARAYVSETADIDHVAIHLRPLKWHTEGFGLE